MLAREAPDNLASLRGFFQYPDRRKLAVLLSAIAADGPGVTEDEVRAIRVPTLVIGHDVDHAHPLAFAQRLAQTIPGARLAVIAPKAIDKSRYLGDFRAALGGFLSQPRPSEWRPDVTATQPARPAPGWLEALPADRLLAEMSLWSADLGGLRDDIARVGDLTDIFHIDVADGHFAPAMLFFPDLVAVARKATNRPLHVHLMVADDVLLSQIDQFAEAGADLISVHAENANCAEALDAIASKGLKAGVVLMLDTPVAAAKPFLGKLSMLTLLGTRIGVKGQDLATEAMPRLAEAKAMIAAAGRSHRIVLAADGGIREHTVPGLRKAGAETIVMGSLAFGAKNFAERMAWVRAMPSQG